MASHVGHPSELLDISTLEQFYSGLEIKPNEHFKNNYAANIFHNNRLFSKLKDKVNKTEWNHHSRSTDANAYYGAVSCKEGIRCIKDNSMEIPAAFLQGAFFSKDRPQYMNFGAAGFVIGHEITHGFDNIGRQYNWEGDLENWWQPEAETRYNCHDKNWKLNFCRYLEMAKCLIDQYNNYTIKELGNMRVNGDHTQVNNI